MVVGQLVILKSYFRIAAMSLSFARMKLPKPRFGIKTLFALTALVAIACAVWPRLQPFASMETGLRKGNVPGTQKTYVWHGGLAITVTKFAGEWPSVRRCTDIDVAELEELQAEAMREDAEEQARADARQAAR